jgi:hypothetical protein
MPVGVNVSVWIHSLAVMRGIIEQYTKERVVVV